jgi:hypothetical protein
MVFLGRRWAKRPQHVLPIVGFDDTSRAIDRCELRGLGRDGFRSGGLCVG